MRNLPNFYFDRLLLFKVYKIWANKSVEELWLMIISSKFEEKLIYCFKKDKNLVNFDLNTQNSQNFYLDWFILCKVYNVWPKNVQRSYVSWHWRMMQNLKKNWLVVWNEEFGKFSPEHLKVSQFGLWWDPFIQSRICMSLKFTEELCVMTMNNDAKFQEGMTCRFKIDRRNLTNFDRST